MLNFLCLYSQQNGVVERNHQHLLNVARALLFQAHMPFKFWGDAMLIVAYLINRVPTHSLHNETPYEILFHKSPTYKHLTVFWSLCFSSTIPSQRKKFDNKTKSYVFIGYPLGVKDFKLYDLETNIVFISQDVLFYKHLFPFHPYFSHLPPTSSNSLNPTLPQFSTLILTLSLLW